MNNLVLQGAIASITIVWIAGSLTPVAYAWQRQHNHEPIAQPSIAQQRIPQSPVQCPASPTASTATIVATLIEQVQQALNTHQPDRAAPLLIQALQAVQSIGDRQLSVQLAESLIANPIQPSSLEQLVSQTIVINQPAIALDALSEAWVFVQQFDSGYSALKTRALSAIANFYQRLQEPDQASAILAQAVRASGTIQGAEFRAIALTEIAQIYADLEETDLARSLLAQAFQFANAIEHRDPGRKARALGRIAVAYATVGNQERSLQIAQTIQDRIAKASVFQAIARQLAQSGHLHQALQLVQSIELPDTSARTLAMIAGIYAQHGFVERADQLFHQAVTITHRTAEDASTTLAAITVQYAQDGRPEVARTIAQTFSDLPTRVQTLAAIASVYGDANQPDQAIATLSEALDILAAVDSPQHDVLVQSIIQTYLAQGDYRLALRAAQALRNDQTVSVPTLLEQIVNQATAAGDYDVAVHAARSIPSGWLEYADRSHARIAIAYASAGQYNRAVQVIERARSSSLYQIQTLAAIAGQALFNGRSDWAMPLFTQALTAAAELESRSRADALVAIVIQYAKAGWDDRANMLHTQALNLAASLPQSNRQASVLRSIVAQYVTAEQYGFALNTAEVLPESRQRNAALDDIADRLMQTGQLDLATTAATAMTVPDVSARFFLTIADRYLQTKQPDQAIQMLNQAYDMATRIPDSAAKTPVNHNGQVIDNENDRTHLLEAIARYLAQAGEYAQAVQVAQTLQSSPVRDRLLQQLTCYQ